MEKKKKLKNRVLAGFLALTLSGATPVLVKGEEQIVQEETQVELVDMFKMEDADLSEPNFDGCEYEYVSEDGKTSKYYISYLNEIDGLKRTKNKRKIKDLISYNVEDYAFEGDYCYLYCNAEWGYLIPLFSKDLLVNINGVEYIRTNMVTTSTQEQIDVLLETGTFRLTDNSVRVIDTFANNRKRDGFIGFGIMEPLELTEDTISGMADYLDQDEKAYNASYDGYLISPYFAEVSKIFLSAPDEEKIITLKRNK